MHRSLMNSLVYTSRFGWIVVDTIFRNQALIITSSGHAEWIPVSELDVVVAEGMKAV